LAVIVPSRVIRSSSAVSTPVTVTVPALKCSTTLRWRSETIATWLFSWRLTTASSRELTLTYSGSGSPGATSASPVSATRLTAQVRASITAR
jgi:hypothetical protein